MRMYIRDRRLDCGEFVYADIFPVFPAYPGQRKSKAAPTTEIQSKLNERHAQKKLEQLIHTNFGPADLEVHLTYKTDMTEDAAAAELTKYLRRLNYARAKAGIAPMKYICVTERGKQKGRIHHHITMDGALPREAVESVWRDGCVYAGRVNARGLQFDETGIAGLSHYILKDPVGYRRWNSSKNLEKPAETVHTGRISQRDVRDAVDNEDLRALDNLYPGTVIVDSQIVWNDLTGCAYISLKMIRTDGWLYKKIERQRRKFAAAARRIAGAGEAG